MSRTRTATAILTAALTLSAATGCTLTDTSTTRARAAEATTVVTYNTDYAAENNDGAGSPNEVRWIDRTANSDIVIIAPHAVNHYRDGKPKVADVRTGGMGQYIAETMGASFLAPVGPVGDWGEDWDTRNDAFTDVLRSLPDDTVIIDLHGMADRDDGVEVSVGTSRKGAPHIAAALQATPYKTEVDGKFPARSDYTVTTFMQARGHRAAQVELSADLRSPKRADETALTLARALAAL